jgi:predicted enzyme related to lactoylglutathione lyase
VDYRGITWAGIPVEDFDGAVAFFRDRLGIRVSRIDNDRQVAHFRLANSDLVELFGPVSTEEPYRRNVVVALGVEDVDKARTEMEKAGVSFLTETNTWEDESWCFFEGPEGLVFEIKAKQPPS